MRGMGISQKDAEMTGVAAATALLIDKGAVSAHRALTLPSPASHHTPYSSMTDLTKSGLPDPAAELMKALKVPGRLQEDAQQIKKTFEEVKAELAATVSDESPTPSSNPASPSTSPVRIRTLSMSMSGKSPPTATMKQPRRPSTTSSSAESEGQNRLSVVSSSRADMIQSRIGLLETKIKQLQEELGDELRLGKNMAILTPFQRTTRDRIQAAAMSVGKRVRMLRIELARLACHRFILVSDLAGEEKDRERVKRDALMAATRRLSVAEERPPRLALQIAMREPTHGREEPSVSSTAESYHSALDGTEPNSIMVSTLLPAGSPFTSEPQPMIRDTLTPTQSPLLNPTDIAPSSPGWEGHEKFYTAVEGPEEIAEEWNETRAAKRVSLVRVPSQVRLAVLNRHLRVPTDSTHATTIEDPTEETTLSIDTNPDPAMPSKF